MKYLLITFSLLISTVGWSVDKFISLKQYSKENDITHNLSNAYYFNARCTSLYFSLTKLMKSPEKEDAKEKLEFGAMTYFARVSSLAPLIDKNENWFYKLEETIEALTKVYTQLGNDNYLREEQHLSKIHLEDLEVCRRFLLNQTR